MKISAVICAAGKGERAGFAHNKLLEPLYGAPALFHTLEKFAIPCINEVIVACSPADMREITALCAPFGYTAAEGGATRTESVYRALKHCTGDIVLIHDGARPYVTEDVIEGCIKGVLENRSAVCAVPATDTVAVARDAKIEDVPDRSSLFCLQTPQGFYLSDISAAYERAVKDGHSYTDDSAVYRAYIGNPALCKGSRDNIKLTYKSDFKAAYPAINAAKGQAVGIGVDVHVFGKEQNYVTLCGVKVPHTCGLIAHSDGDAPVHAAMDALLSAAGLNDIGHYFPDTDDRYSGADSMELLKKVVALIKGEGFRPAAMSVTIRAEKPRLSPYIGQMKQNLRAATGLGENAVGVSAGTAEKLGFVGKGLGIEAAAVALLERINGKE